MQLTSSVTVAGEGLIAKIEIAGSTLEKIKLFSRKYGFPVG
jgi:hypothetical protein